jgi:hypothetical protein
MVDRERSVRAKGGWVVVPPSVARREIVMAPNP